MERRLRVSEASSVGNAVESRIPSRMDRLPWARWPWLVVIALGVTWILDGLEVTIVSTISVVLATPEAGLKLTEGQIGTAAGIYIAGAARVRSSFLLLPHRPLRTKEAVPDHAGRLPHLQLPHGLLVELLELRRVPLYCGDGYRR